MDHVVYMDAKADEFSKLKNGEKTAIIRGATGRKLPYGRVEDGDVLYFINNNSEGVVKARAIVSSVFNSEKMSSDESTHLVDQYQDSLRLSDAQYKKWAGKRYLVIISIENFELIEAFKLDKTNFGNMDDWLAVENIENVRIN